MMLYGGGQEAKKKAQVERKRKRSAKAADKKDKAEARAGRKADKAKRKAEDGGSKVSNSCNTRM